MTARPFLHKVLYRDCDMMGVVNNANYVHFMEDARVDALSQIGCEYKGMEERGFAGPVLRLSVKDGDTVSEGQEVLVLEAMKMETVISAPASGTITLLVKQGDQVQTGHPLAEIK